MVKRKLKLFFTCIVFLFFTSLLYANPNIDQWQESEKTYKDLINEGFEVKSYAINNIETVNGLYILLFVTVLQKDDEIYDFLKGKYGEWILYEPEFNKNTYFLWLLPILLFFIGGAIIFKLFILKKNLVRIL